MVARGGGRSPFVITLRASERRFLKRLVRKQTAQQRQVIRSRIVLLAAAGWTNRGIARKLGLAPNTVGKWRKRFFEEGFDACVTASGPAVRAPSRPRSSPRARRSPANCRPPAGYRLAAGALPSSSPSPPPGSTAGPSGGHGARSLDSDWFNWPSYSRLRGGGCYAYQVDGASGSQVIVFHA
jgi:hypothetical protein